MINVGRKVLFVPGINDSKVLSPEERKPLMITGSVVYINWEHKWFEVEFDCGGTKQRESFKFCDIGSVVKICGGI